MFLFFTVSTPVISVTNFYNTSLKAVQAMCAPNTEMLRPAAPSCNMGFASICPTADSTVLVMELCGKYYLVTLIHHVPMRLMGITLC